MLVADFALAWQLVLSGTLQKGPADFHWEKRALSKVCKPSVYTLLRRKTHEILSYYGNGTYCDLFTTEGRPMKFCDLSHYYIIHP
ncbi:hypothetical protein AQUCO_04100064v1 [Aquilegia coerulea]|uniref:Uncharacterized protein n=1 Tax=Aquilegia coerulea TaxID=218851 RepID=A0A2G5CQ22_AQUCA|nr:hypothetical protein AQUCO_04100064v1 [Aquilegia coerulea]